jgi:hypothetical protein
MAKNVYLIGHGGWNRAKGGLAFVTVPKGCSISFYSEMGVVLTVGQAIAAMQGHRVPARYYPQYRSTPNQVLYPLYTEGTHTEMGESGGAYTLLRAAAFGTVGQGDEFVWVDSETTVKNFFDQYSDVNFHWLACSVRELDET